MRRFYLDRQQDVSGRSGTGYVAEGVEYSDGIVAMRWTTATATTVLFKSMDDVEKIHGHEGRTVICYVDAVHSTPADTQKDAYAVAQAELETAEAGGGQASGNGAIELNYTMAEGTDPEALAQGIAEALGQQFPTVLTDRTPEIEVEAIPEAEIEEWVAAAAR